MAESDQVRPLAPTLDPRNNDDEEAYASTTTTTTTALNPDKKGGERKRRCMKCCGGIIAILLIQAIVIVILIFTVFKVKDPEINLKSVTVDQLDLVNGSMPRPGSNMTLTADLSVKNPNYASFKYSNTTTTLYYHGTVVGEARGPPGKSRARRTARMNITIDLMTDKLIQHPMLSGDVNSGLLPMSSFSRVGGRVKMLKIVNKHVVVKMNCSITVNITSRAIQDQKCKRKIKI